MWIGFHAREMAEDNQDSYQNTLERMCNERIQLQIQELDKKFQALTANKAPLNS